MMNNTDSQRNILTTPLSDRGIPRGLVIGAAILGFVYILNPTMGIFEFIPDNIPFVGNLDEGGAFALIWYGLLEILEKRKRTATQTEEHDGR